MLYNILLIAQIIISVSIIGLVLIQHGKGADAGAAFGSGASGTVFGSRGSGNFLSRMTGILAALFFANSLGLAWIVAHKPETTSLVDGISAAPTEKVEKAAATTDNADKTKTAVVDETTQNADDKKSVEKSPADDIPADTGETATSTVTESADKTSEIPE